MNHLDWETQGTVEASVVIPKIMCVLDAEIPSPTPDSFSRNVHLEAGDQRFFLDGICGMTLGHPQLSNLATPPCSEAES